MGIENTRQVITDYGQCKAEHQRWTQNAIEDYMGMKDDIQQLSDQFDEFRSYVPLKSAVVKIEGAGGSDPTLLDSYNVTSVTRQAAGVYRATITQTSFYSTDLLDNSYTTSAWNIQASANTDDFAIIVSAVSSSQFDIKVFEVTQGAGSDLVLTAYDIIAGDFIDVSKLLNIKDGLPPE